MKSPENVGTKRFFSPNYHPITTSLSPPDKPFLFLYLCSEFKLERASMAKQIYAIKEANYVSLNNFQEQWNTETHSSLSVCHHWDGPLHPRLCKIQGGAIHKGIKCMTTIPMALVGCSMDGFMMRESNSLAGRIWFLF